MSELRAPHQGPEATLSEHRLSEGAKSSNSVPGGSDGAEPTTVSLQDLESRRFTVTVRGYDVEEVNDFLTKVGDSYRRALDAIETLQASREPLNPFRSLGDEVAPVLSPAHGAATQVRADAEHQAEGLRGEAREELLSAIRHREEAEQEAEALSAQVRAELNSAIRHREEAEQEAEALRAQVREARKLHPRMETSEEGNSILEAVDAYVRSLSEARRNSVDATLGATSNLADLLARLAVVEGLEEDLINRLDRTASMLRTAGSEDAVEAADSF